jgi:hypothetical protein
MSIPRTYAPIKIQDFTLTPLKVNKQFYLHSDQLNTTGSGYTLVDGYYSSIITPIFTFKAQNDPINSSNGSYKHVTWKSIDHLYYREPYHPFNSFEHSNKRYTHKFLNLSASILSVPYMDYGEKIKPGSVRIYNSDLDLEIVDDSNGNLYDPVLRSSIAKFENSSTIGYWGFNSQFREFKYNYGYLEHGKYHYESSVFSTDNYPSIIYNTSFYSGPVISGSNCGISAEFNRSGEGYGFIRTPNQTYFNFDSTNEFVISFWINPASSHPQTGSIISKNGVEFVNQLGDLPYTYSSNGTVTSGKHISGSHLNRPIDVFPFDFTYVNDQIIFGRSDGVNSVRLELPVSSSVWSHVSAIRYKQGSTYRINFRINGDEQVADVPDSTNNPINKHDLMFGSRTMDGINPYYGALDEVRFVNQVAYNSGSLDESFYNQLPNLDYMYNTDIVGNVFYRRGNIVVTPLNQKYQDIMSGSYTVEYKSVHTIYQYEVLCRIKKGDFNCTLNPTALESPQTDLLRSEVTGSKFRPYATTVGLYNDQGELVAVGKFGQPVQMREDVDINVLVRWDV